MTNVNATTESTLDLEKGLISNAGIYYAKITKPAKMYEKDEDFEYIVDAHVNKNTFKAYKKAFPKQSVKEMDYEDFVAKFGAENVIGGEGDEQYFIKLKKAAQYYKDGVRHNLADIYRPRIFQEVNGELVDITFDESKKVANGSVGTILLELYTSKFGQSAKLKAVRVDNLIVYEGSGSNNAFGALGSVVTLAEAPKQQSVGDTATNDTSTATTAQDDDWE